MVDENGQPPGSAMKVDIKIGLEGVTVRFPPGYWQDPTQNLTLTPDGKRMWHDRLGAMANIIAQGVAQYLDMRGFILEDGSLFVPTDATELPTAPTKPRLELVKP